MHNYCPGAGEGELQLTLMAARYIVYDCVHPATGYAAGEQKATKPLTFMRLLLHFVRQTWNEAWPALIFYALNMQKKKCLQFVFITHVIKKRQQQPQSAV